MVSINLEDFGRYFDERGVLFSPLLERGSNNIPNVVPILSAGDLRSLRSANVNEHMQLLGQYGFINTPEKLVEMNSSFLSRYNIMPGDPRYQAELQRLLDSGSGRVLLEQAQRVSERFETISSLNGDMTQNCMYLAEGDGPCAECEELNGIEGSYAELLRTDRIPGARCLGGDACRCAIVPID